MDNQGPTMTKILLLKAYEMGKQMRVVMKRKISHKTDDFFRE